MVVRLNATVGSGPNSWLVALPGKRVLRGVGPGILLKRLPLTSVAVPQYSSY